MNPPLATRENRPLGRAPTDWLVDESTARNRRKSPARAGSYWEDCSSMHRIGAADGLFREYPGHIYDVESPQAAAIFAGHLDFALLLAG